MARITYIEHGGKKIEADVNNGDSVMQGAIDNSVENVIAECGGGCACGTCHVYVDEAWLNKLEPADSMESGMLDCVLEPRENSRLSCQIKVTDELDGLVVQVPEAQY